MARSHADPPFAVEITSKAMAGALHSAASVRCDVEGLLLGRALPPGESGGDVFVVERLLFAGESWSLCAPNGALTDRTRGLMQTAGADHFVLGWYVVRESAGPYGLALTQKDRLVHKSLATVVSPRLPLGIIIATCEQGELGSFAIENCCIAGTNMNRVALRVRSLGRTDGGASVKPSLLPPSGPMRGILPGLADRVCKTTETFEAEVKDALQLIQQNNRILPSKFYMFQRESVQLYLEACQLRSAKRLKTPTLTDAKIGDGQQGTSSTDVAAVSVVTYAAIAPALKTNEHDHGRGNAIVSELPKNVEVTDPKPDALATDPSPAHAGLVASALDSSTQSLSLDSGDADGKLSKKGRGLGRGRVKSERQLFN